MVVRKAMGYHYTELEYDESARREEWQSVELAIGSAESNAVSERRELGVEGSQ